MREIEFNGKKFPLVGFITFGEGMEIEDNLSDLFDVQKRIASGDAAQIDAVMEKMKALKPANRKMIIGTLKKCLGKSDEEIKALSYPEAIILFLKVWEANQDVTDFLGKK